MSGIAGIARRSPLGVSVRTLGSMAAAIKHRGPDGYGFYAGRTVGLAHVRLDTLDERAVQPLTNEDGQLVLTANAEIFNHPELRKELEERGHVFRTRCHAEVLVHGYEEWGEAMLPRLDGQFAIAIYDRRREAVFVARDRFGIRPLYYAQRNGDLYFASEIKAILATGEVDAALDPRGLDETLGFGAPRPPRTVFSGIASLEPGTYGVWRDGALWLRTYYELDYPELSEEPDDVIERLDEVLLRSVGMRLRATIPVGAHLSGGLDSAIAASLARSAASHPLHTFSISHAVPEYDDSLHRHQVAVAIGTRHTASVIETDTIAHTLPDVLWHAETPMLSIAPALVFHLAKLARESGTKVLFGGEGADEIFLGGEIFKEASVRRFCIRQPNSCIRPRLFDRVFSDLSPLDGNDGMLADLMTGGLHDPLFSHLPRFRSVGIGGVYTPEFKSLLGGIDVVGELRASLPTRFFAWSPLNQASYLEMTTRLSPYVLSTHGDRMTGAHGVEARYPFLDHRVFEFGSALPTGSRLRGLRDQEVLKRWAARALPDVAAGRQVARRPLEIQSLFLQSSSSWIGDHLTPESLRRVGIFSLSAVSDLVERCRGNVNAPRGDCSAIIGVLSTQLWYQQFVEKAALVQPLPTSESSVLIGDGVPATNGLSASIIGRPDPALL